VLKKTTVTELIGIKIAATSGLICPEMAIVKPIILYDIENVRQLFKTTLEYFDS
jgi:hypothetical protein